MAMKDWFRRKPASENVGTSKGGSRLIRYGDRSDLKPEVGFLDESTLSNTEERERVYSDLFGESDTVLHELLPLVPHIDVYRFPPNGKRDFFTFVTGGMSDLPMNSPSELGADYRRAELVFYSTEDRDDYPELLRRLAHFVHDNNTWLHWGHSMPNGQPPERLFDTKHLDSLFFMPSIVNPDSTLGDRLQIDSDPVHLIWCVPITTAECQLKLDNGTDALYDLFDVNKHPFVFTGDRQSYV
ncbi:suppressor of fused domain protein [Stieleria varia]|uniref:Suppressor of fused protein (SUFU) n=1 Tax=Stieleria varia TaxID=2528005 RepID=A0A5C6APJ3_9BACT|nr:suppressor of fused domain protein [Stieleria varia]TWU01036.1 Suppressor of fused protein (SUFU) [Stieleria varia]